MGLDGVVQKTLGNARREIHRRFDPSWGTIRIKMPDPAVKFTLDVTADCDAALERYCTNYLIDRGFNVARPYAKWETVGDFRSRLGIRQETFRRKIRQSPSRPNVQLQYSESPGSKRQRVLGICSNKDFDAWCVAGK